MLSLVVMAAGLGSRYKGGIKQLAKVGKNGETIMELSINNAIKAGFNEVIFILRKDILDDFEELVGSKISVNKKYVFQEIESGRTKPWGTGEAVLKVGSIDNSFAVINADDYYDYDAFKKLYDYLSLQDVNSYNYAMSGYILKNTLSLNGGVNRGICKLENGYLKDVEEVTNIKVDSDIDMKSIVSMNIWGFTPTILRELDERFKKHKLVTSEEFFLPQVVDELINEGKATVRVLETDSKWYGITYSEDLEYVKENLGG